MAVPVPTNEISTTLVISLLWFILYWIAGGVVFAVVAVTRLLRMKKAQFSCLFTIASAAAAYGATTTGLIVRRPARCAPLDFPDWLSWLPERVLSCNLNQLLLAGGAWFALLLLVSILLMLMSQRDQKMLTPKP